MKVEHLPEREMEYTNIRQEGGRSRERPLSWCGLLVADDDDNDEEAKNMRVVLRE